MSSENKEVIVAKVSLLNDLVDHHDRSVAETITSSHKLAGFIEDNPQIEQDDPATIAFKRGQIDGRRTEITALTAFIEMAGLALEGEITLKTLNKTIVEG